MRIIALTTALLVLAAAVCVLWTRASTPLTSPVSDVTDDESAAVSAPQEGIVDVKGVQLQLVMPPDFPAARRDAVAILLRKDLRTILSLYTLAVDEQGRVYTEPAALGVSLPNSARILGRAEAGELRIGEEFASEYDRLLAERPEIVEIHRSLIGLLERLNDRTLTLEETGLGDPMTLVEPGVAYVVPGDVDSINRNLRNVKAHYQFYSPSILEIERDSRFEYYCRVPANPDTASDQEVLTEVLFVFVGLRWKMAL